MQIDFLQEPELEFGVDKHIDIRFGIMNYGTVDYSSPLAPKEIRLGIVGTNETIEGVSSWFEKCRNEIPAKESRQPNLFPKFPGFRLDIAFQSSMTLSDRLQRTIKAQVFSDLSTDKDKNRAISTAVDLFLEELDYLASSTKVDVLICAVPPALLDLTEAVGEQGDQPDEFSTFDNKINFHHLLKAKAMRLNIPVQLIIPSTYDEAKRRRQKRKSNLMRKPQDEATRAWNLHTALYYKAKGIPWRLVRTFSEYATCYIGISFYKTLDGSALLTSVAQVFNERGEGVIVRGGQAQISKEDRQVHLDYDNAYTLLNHALNVYKAEHKNLPARVVIHKSSSYAKEEKDAFLQASKSFQVDMVDLLNIDQSFTRLFRTGSYPPLRGSFLSLDEKNHLITLHI